jgi:cysteinyl-tRNA synthetase
MNFKIYNTYGKKLEEFKPIKEGLVTMYNCGPTVYDFVHVGNLRTFLMADFLRRSLDFFGYEVKQVKNITDVGHLTQDDIDAGEDKMMKAANREHKTPQDIARFYEETFHEDEVKLNILPAFVFPRATEYVEEMIKMVEKLIQNGHAYEVNGSVYYEVDTFPDYGKLSGNTIENLKIGARLEANPEKKKPYDFALWLKADESHLMKWQSPWGIGYPGWHIECSAMSTKNLGETIDIHTGAEDNVFPHHEDEIAQTEGATGKKFANYWIHGRHLLIDGEKMSKSKGNFYTLKDIIEKGFDPLAFRYLCFTASFTSNLNFTWQSLEDGKNALEKLYAFVGSIQNTGEIIKSYEEKFKTALAENLNTPLALSVVWEMLKDKNFKEEDRKATLLLFDKVLGLDVEKNQKISEDAPEEIKQLVAMREEARQNKDFTTSDKIRDEIQAKGYSIEDTAEGVKISKK